VAPEPASWLEVDVAGIVANARRFRTVIDADMANRTEGDDRVLLCAVVKANAYGLGADRIVPPLARAGVDMFAVYSAEQACRLADLNIPQPILLLCPLRRLADREAICRLAQAGRLHLSIHDREQAQELESQAGAMDCRIPVHIHADTGMARSGMTDGDVLRLLQESRDLPHIAFTGLYSHLATADSDPAFAEAQVQRLDALLARIGDRRLLVHVANSAGTLRHRWFHRQMVRVGIGLYGYAPPDLPMGAGAFRHGVRWCSRLNHVQAYPAGTVVGYDCTFRLAQPGRLGVVPAGYADGYPLALSNRGASVRFPEAGTACEHVVAPVVGRVSMDQVVVDLSHLPQHVARVGSLVELISAAPSAPNALPQLAKLADSHCYELLTRIAAHVERRYVGEDAAADPVG
jgi:alanine racemase